MYKRQGPSTVITIGIALTMETLLLHGSNWTLSDVRSVSVSEESLSYDYVMKNLQIWLFDSLLIFSFVYKIPNHLVFSSWTSSFLIVHLMSRIYVYTIFYDVILKYDFIKYLITGMHCTSPHRDNEAHKKTVQSQNWATITNVCTNYWWALTI